MGEPQQRLEEGAGSGEADEPFVHLGRGHGVVGEVREEVEEGKAIRLHRVRRPLKDLRDPAVGGHEVVLHAVGDAEGVVVVDEDGHPIVDSEEASEAVGVGYGSALGESHDLAVPGERRDQLDVATGEIDRLVPLPHLAQLSHGVVAVTARWQIRLEAVAFEGASHEELRRGVAHSVDGQDRFLGGEIATELDAEAVPFLVQRTLSFLVSDGPEVADRDPRPPMSALPCRVGPSR